MNYTTAVMLINPNIRAIKATYENGATPEIFKTLDETVQVDDLVVVETDTRHNMTVVKVTEVDVDVDFDSTKHVKWVVQKVDKEAHENLKKEESRAVDAIKKAELRKKREEIRSNLLAAHAEAIQNLPIASMGEQAALPNNTAASSEAA